MGNSGNIYSVRVIYLHKYTYVYKYIKTHITNKHVYT